MKKQNQNVKMIDAALLALSFGGLLLMLAGCSASEANSNAAEAVMVRTAKVEAANIAQPIRATGLLSGKAESRLSFKIGGILDRIYVSEGQSVRQGRLLATLNLAEINAQVNQAQNAFDKAARDLKRVQNLYKDEVTTLEQLQDATTGYEVTRSALEIAQFNRRHASIYAPSSGRILKRLFAEENELISPGTPVLVLSSAKEGWVLKAGLADRDVVRVRPGDTARLAFDAYPTHSFSATVTEIASAAAPMTGTYEVELKIDPVDGVMFMSGMVGKAEISPARKSRVWLVPIESLLEADGQQGSVYMIVSSNTAKKIDVAVAFIYGHQVAINSGLENITAVVTDGAAYLNDGAAVKIMP